MEWLGDLERAFASSIYPNRGLIAIAIVVGAAIIGLVGWRARWDRIVVRHLRVTFASLAVGLALVVPIAWYLGSPLLLSTTIDEPAPAVAAASSPRPSVAARPIAPASPEPRGRATPAPAVPSPKPVAAVERSGSFTGADEFHFASGDARLVETAPGEFTVRLEDFAVRNGPDLFVYLSPSGDGYADDAVELGRLKADRGNQNYRVPGGTEVDSARSVVIWCKQFGVLFAAAPLA